MRNGIKYQNWDQIQSPITRAQSFFVRPGHEAHENSPDKLPGRPVGISLICAYFSPWRPHDVPPFYLLYPCEDGRLNQWADSTWSWNPLQLGAAPCSLKFCFAVSFTNS